MQLYINVTYNLVLPVIELRIKNKKPTIVFGCIFVFEYKESMQ